MKEYSRHPSTAAGELPAYSVAEAAHYLGIPRNTLRAWSFGQRYRHRDDWHRFEPVIEIADAEAKLLSFLNLVEIHVLDALRRKHQISLQKLRLAIRTLASIEKTKHPLASNDFATAGFQVFVEKYGELINLSQQGQVEMRELLKAYLRRVERDHTGLPIKLYPYTRGKELDEPRHVVIDPRIAFGRPTIGNTGVPTSAIAERYKAGESMDALAHDYEIDRVLIEEAVRCELEAA